MKPSTFFYGILCYVIIFSTSCYQEDIPDINENSNLLADPSVNLFELDRVEFEGSSNFFKDVRLYFTTLYDQLEPSQQERINQIIVDYGAGEYTLDLDRTFFYNPDRRVGTTVCYNLFFKTRTEEVLTRPTEICVKVE